MPLRGILGRRKRIGDKRNPFSSRIRSLIPIQYILISLAFFVPVALHVNSIEAQQSTLDHLAWHDSRRSKEGGKAEADPAESASESSAVYASLNNTSTPSSSVETIVVGWAVTITGCGSDAIEDGAAVLKHSIHSTSIHGRGKGKYDYKLYAIYHPEGEACALTLKDLGYELIRRETPVAVKDIEGKFLRKKIESNGCCGAKELIKLESYTLMDHPVVVQLDLDVIVLKPMDALFDLMLADDDSSDPSNVPIMWPNEPIPETINAFFTRDCKALQMPSCIQAMPWSDHLIAPERPYKAVQGGFLVLRPDMAVYSEFVDIIKKGIQKPGGWGGLVGPFYGFMTIQGIIPYYYDVLHNKTEAIELNRCIYNQMMDNPRDNTANDNPQAKCRTNQEECEDCRTRPLEDVVSAHYTFCPKPWNCFPNDVDTIELRLCRKLHHEWFRIRGELEQSWGRDSVGTGTFQKEHFFGFCSDFGQAGYMGIGQPYGMPVPSTSEGTDESDGDSKDIEEDDEEEEDEA
ncbi:MAG: hypothetical protein SGBAC_006117 [Bacillariaceae sp.]